MIACKQICGTWWCQQNNQCYEARRAGIDKERVRALYARTQHLADAYPKRPKKVSKPKKVSIKKKDNYPDIDTKGMSGRQKWRLTVFERDNFICVYCGFKGNQYSLTVDHIVPQARQGTNELSNCATACKRCNCLKGSMDVEIFKQYLKDLIDRGIIEP